MNGIRVRDVTFRWPQSRRTLFRDVNFDVQAGQRVGIDGPNGAGKTTLMSLLLGLQVPDSGTITIDGLTPIAARPSVGYMPQLTTLDSAAPVTVLDVVLMGRLARSGWGLRYGRRDRVAAMEALDRVGVRAIARRAFALLSGGERQRVLIARALAGNPRTLFLDEPTAGMDRDGRRELTELLAPLLGSMTMVVISHDAEFLTAVSTHRATLDGRFVMAPIDEWMSDDGTCRVCGDPDPVVGMDAETAAP